MGLRQVYTISERGFGPEIPASFTSLEEAHNSLHYHCNQCIALNFEIAEHPLYERLYEPKVYLGIFDRWNQSFQSWRQEENFSPSDEEAARTLEVNSKIFVLELDVVMQQNPPRQIIWESDGPRFQPLSPLIWDAYTARFQVIVAAARNIIEDDAQVAVNRGDCKYTSDVNLVPTLFAVIRLCRDPALRREAVALLHKLPIQEGIWNSITTARVCEKLIQVEEEGLGIVTKCEDVPEWARVQLIKTHFDREGRLGSINCTRYRNPLGCYGRAVLDKILLWAAD